MLVKIITFLFADVLAKFVSKQVTVEQPPQIEENDGNADVVAAAMSDVFGETEMEPQSLQQTNRPPSPQNVPETTTERQLIVIHEQVHPIRKPVIRKNPQKKNTIQTAELGNVSFPSLNKLSVSMESSYLQRSVSREVLFAET